ETNQKVSDFHTTEGSVNGSLTDRHYRYGGVFCRCLPLSTILMMRVTSVQSVTKRKQARHICHYLPQKTAFFTNVSP
ncbi:hypothetical protein, partial [Aeromonas veronii]|uniref:hypothetical protein n=1 Tax=Aeromonas veronii TaxID=654 RepID=UPI003D216610